MRRRFWREPPKSSICAFCTHRFGAAPPAIHIQQRFISFSNANCRSTAAGANQLEADTSNAITPGRTFSRPAFGRAKFGAAVNSESTRSSDTSPPAFDSSRIELTDEEKAMRDVVSEADVKLHQQPIAIYAGEGPQATRAGRINPEEAKQKELKEATTLRGQAFYKQHYGVNPVSTSELQSRRPVRNNPAQTGGGGFQVRTVRSVDRRLAQQEPKDQQREPWGHLRRRGEPQQQQQILEDQFSQGREGREEQARTGKFTPLFSGSVTSRPKPLRETSGLNNESEGKDAYVARHGAAKSRTQFAHGMDPYDQGQTSRQGTVKLRRAKPAFDDDLTFEARQKVFDVAERKIQGTFVTPKKASKVSSRFDSRSYEATPRGKDRDKARRRQQFGVREDEDGDDEREALAEERRLRRKAKAAAKKAALTPVLLPAYISVANLSTVLKVKYEVFVEKMEELGFQDVKPDLILNGEDAGLIAGEYKYEPMVDRDDVDLKPRPAHEDPSTLPQRPPVVTIMGHVDHGKTTLLDYLRKSSVAASEHGGITQHIGAFSVKMPSGKIITFLDTPGHAAFLNMRQRGANVTDIVILVVAADDSVKPQTIEAINHAQSAKVPIIVAVNKIDKEGSNVEAVKQDLARHGVEIEDFGGDTQVVPVSGKTGQGMEQLEETVITLSEVIDMRAETTGPAEGWVLEASIKSMGKVATVLVRRGTMRPGDVIVAGTTWARIRCLRNEAGMEIESAGPGTPVEIDGWREQPLAGDEVLQAESEALAKDVVDYRLERVERDALALDIEAINESRKVEQAKRAEEKRVKGLSKEEVLEEEAAAALGAEKPAGVQQVYFIVKGDVSGSVEAVIDSISALGNAEVVPNILRSGVGQLAEFDVEHAAIAKGILINFNTPIEPNIAGMAERAKVPVLNHNIIYRLVDDVKAKMSEYLPPLVTQRVLGEAEVAQIFEIHVKGRKVKNIAGAKVRNGVVSKSAKTRVMRNGEKVFDGHLSSFKNVKKDITEMRKGGECGMGFEGWTDFQIGDQVQSYETKEEKRYL